MGRPTRIRPLVSSMLKALRRAPSVDTSASGEFEPSLVRNMGSSPRVSWKRVRSSSGVIVHAVDATWQDAHDLPLPPRFLKNGFEVSSGLPSRVIERSTPEEFLVSSAYCWPLTGGT